MPMQSINYMGFGARMGAGIRSGLSQIGQDIDQDTAKLALEKELQNLDAAKVKLADDVAETMSGKYSQKQIESTKNYIMGIQDKEELLRKGKAYHDNLQRFKQSGGAIKQLPLFGMSSEHYMEITEPEIKRAQAGERAQTVQRIGGQAAEGMATTVGTQRFGAPAQTEGTQPGQYTSERAAPGFQTYQPQIQKIGGAETQKEAVARTERGLAEEGQMPLSKEEVGTVERMGGLPTREEVAEGKPMTEWEKYKKSKEESGAEYKQVMDKIKKDAAQADLNYKEARAKNEQLKASKGKVKGADTTKFKALDKLKISYDIQRKVVEDKTKEIEAIRANIQDLEDAAYTQSKDYTELQKSLDKLAKERLKLRTKLEKLEDDKNELLEMADTYQQTTMQLLGRSGEGGGSTEEYTDLTPEESAQIANLRGMNVSEDEIREYVKWLRQQ